MFQCKTKRPWPKDFLVWFSSWETALWLVLSKCAAQAARRTKWDSTTSAAHFLATLDKWRHSVAVKRSWVKELPVWPWQWRIEQRNAVITSSNLWVLCWHHLVVGELLGEKNKVNYSALKWRNTSHMNADAQKTSITTCTNDWDGEKKLMGTTRQSHLINHL